MVIKLSLDECNQRIKRRSSLKALIDEHYPDKKGSLLICAGIEKTRENFYQDSTFFYFVGICAVHCTASCYSQHNNGDTFCIPVY